MAENTAYDREQAKLKKNLDGESDPDDIRIVAPKHPEVRPEVYKDVEALLYRGFIIVSSDINGVPIVFKSLNHHEFEWVRLVGGFQEGQEPPAKFWAIFLAYCVFIFDGANVLMERSTVLPDLVKMFENFPLQARQRIVRHLSEINRRASNAVTLTEAYATEKTSRFHWAQLQGMDMSMPAVTGIEGTERLGLNWAQLLWRALNHYEDMSFENERAWENAKFVGSCFAGKGLSKVYAQDQKRREQEQQDTAKRKDLLLRHILLGEPLEEGSKPGKTVAAAHSVEELATQLERDLKGEKDFHDQVIAAYENRVKDQYQRRRREFDEIIQKHELENQNTPPVSGSTDIQGLRPEEVKQRVARSKQLAAQSAASRMVYPEFQDPKVISYMNKIGASRPDVETSVSMTDRDIANVVALPPVKGPGTPFRR